MRDCGSTRSWDCFCREDDDDDDDVDDDDEESTRVLVLVTLVVHVMMSMLQPKMTRTTPPVLVPQLPF